MNGLIQLVLGLVVVLLVSVIGLGIAQQGADTVAFTSSDEFCATKDTVVVAVDSVFSWLPMIMLLCIGGIAVAYVVKYLGWI